MFFDTHSHIRPWSHDASQSIDQLLEDAASKGLQGICLTDHYEKDMFYERGYEDIFDPDDFFTALSHLRLNPKSAAAQRKPAFLLGVELGWLPHLSNHLQWLTASYPFDSVIMSMHVFKGKDPYIDDHFFDEGIEIVYPKAISAMLEMITSAKDYDILGHYDYVSRYLKQGKAKMLYNHAPDEFDSLFKQLATDNKCLEINTKTTVRMRSMGYSYEESFPDPAIIKRFFELGGNHISIGSDTHNYGDAALIFPEMRDWLLSVGVDSLTYYLNREPIEYKL